MRKLILIQGTAALVDPKIYNEMEKVEAGDATGTSGGKFACLSETIQSSGPAHGSSVPLGRHIVS